MGFGKAPLKLRYDDLRSYTNNFSDENYISDFMFGQIYHGKITLPGLEQPKPVTIKIWGERRWPFKWIETYASEDRSRLMDEVAFLHKHSHPGLMKLYGYCCEFEKCGVVYDFKSLNTVQNLTKRDEFKWCQRIKVALQFAQLLKFLLESNPGLKPFVIRNISPAHIMVDEDWNAKLYDFGMVTGGPFPDNTKPPIFIWGCFGYHEPWRTFTPKTDVYAFGAIFLDMIMTRKDKMIILVPQKLPVFFMKVIPQMDVSQKTCFQKAKLNHNMVITCFRWYTKALELMKGFALQMGLISLDLHILV